MGFKATLLQWLVAPDSMLIKRFFATKNKCFTILQCKHPINVHLFPYFGAVSVRRSSGGGVPDEESQKHQEQLHGSRPEKDFSTEKGHGSSLKKADSTERETYNLNS